MTPLCRGVPVSKGEVVRPFRFFFVFFIIRDRVNGYAMLVQIHFPGYRIGDRLRPPSHHLLVSYFSAYSPMMRQLEVQRFSVTAARFFKAVLRCIIFRDMSCTRRDLRFLGKIAESRSSPRFLHQTSFRFFVLSGS